jgi:hypothetical protein
VGYALKEELPEWGWPYGLETVPDGVDLVSELELTLEVG